MPRIGNTIYNVVDDLGLGGLNTYTKATTHFDGVTALTDSMVDNVIYIKSGSEFFINNQFKLRKEVELKSYGLPGDGVLHTISEILPNVTLAQVHAIDAGATLASSADWYIISMLLGFLPVQSTIILEGNFVLDRAIIMKRGFIEFRGVNSGKANKFLNNRSKIIQTAPGADIFKCVDGDGTTYGYGVGQVNYVTFDNLIIEGTMLADNLSGDGFSFHLSPEGTTGTAINWVFNKVQVRGCLNGFRHVTGHINDFYFNQCDFSINFNAGFVTNGNPQNQPNNFNFFCTGFSANGYKFVSGALVDYVQDPENPDITKGGFLCKQIVAFSFMGVNAQSNKGYGFLIGDGAHIGVMLNGYAEANTLGDVRLMRTKDYNRDIQMVGFYSRDQTVTVDDPEMAGPFLGTSAGNTWQASGGNITSYVDGRKVGIGVNVSNAPLEKLDVNSLDPVTRLRVGFASSAAGVTIGWNNDGGRAEIKSSADAAPVDIYAGSKRMAKIEQRGLVVGQTEIYYDHAPPQDGILSEGGYAALLAGVPDAADDTAAAAANVPVGRFYRTGNALKIRIS